MPAWPDPAAAAVLAGIDTAAAAHPERIAHVWPEGSLTFARLQARSQALSRWLAPDAPRPVLLWGHKEGAMLVGMLACARAGRPYVPADAALPGERVAWMATTARVSACVAARPLSPSLQAALVRQRVRIHLLDPWGEPRPGGSPDEPRVGGDTPAAGAPAPSGGRTPAYIMFTSGTTGRPKGVPITWAGLEHFTSWLLTEQRPTWADEVILNQAPFSFDLSVMDTYLSLLSAGTLFSVTAELVAAPARLFAALGASGLTTWVSTPSFARFCLSEPRFGSGMLPRLRRLVFCGETLAPGLARELLARFPGARLWNTYGPTETTVAVASVRIEVAEGDSPLPVGRPAPGMRVWAAGDDLRPVPDGEPGEVVVAGPQVSPGYLVTAPDGGHATPTGFVTLPATLGGGGAYRTGDVGRVRDGLLYWEGRIDRQVKLHGYRLELDEIEACLRSVPGVADAAVVLAMRRGIPDHLTAFVVEGAPVRVTAMAGGLAPGASPAAASPPEPRLPAAREARGRESAPLIGPAPSPFARAQAIRHALAQHLPAYALPRIIRFLPALPLTANGKVDRRALEDRPD